MNSHDPNRLQQLLKALLDRVNFERQTDASPRSFKLATMLELMQLLGNPNLAAPVIHVAGTKGKGSVSRMIGEILFRSGYRTGIYSSPHLERINQRYWLDGDLISDQQLLALLEKIQPAVCKLDAEFASRNEKGLTFFEISTAIGFQYFAQQHCDAVVLEVGLGGRLDSTNVCQPGVCVITNISLDHTKQLGDTIAKIAFEKAGIIKPGVPVVSGALHPDAMEVIADVAHKRGSRLYQLDRDFFVESNSDNTFASHGRTRTEFRFDALQTAMPGAHQRVNAAVASMVSHVLIEKGWTIDQEKVRGGLAKATLPGRTEIACREPLVMMDMAHNGASILALTQTFEEEVNGRAARKRFLVATTRDKKSDEILAPILEVADEVVLTRYRDNPRGKPLEELAAAADQMIESRRSGGLRVPQVRSFENPGLAWKYLSETTANSDAICIAGSAFLVAELRPQVQAWAARKSALSKASS